MELRLSPTDLTVTDLLGPLAEIDDRGIYFEDTFTNWRTHVQHGAAIAATLRQRLDPTRPPHVGVLLENTPFFSAMLVAAGMSGIVPVGLNPVRRGAALAGEAEDLIPPLGPQCAQVDHVPIVRQFGAVIIRFSVRRQMAAAARR